MMLDFLDWPWEARLRRPGLRCRGSRSGLVIAGEIIGGQRRRRPVAAGEQRSRNPQFSPHAAAKLLCRLSVELPAALPLGGAGPQLALRNPLEAVRTLIEFPRRAQRARVA